MAKYYSLIAVLLTIGLVGCAASLESDDISSAQDDGMPFGSITDTDIDRLMTYALDHGFDLNAAINKAYTNDMDALARVFEFSLTFKRLDKSARAYGHVIYSSLLNLGETSGPDKYSSVLLSQSPPVQQRIRDFLYFAATRVPAAERPQVEEEVREQFPKIFPVEYQFADNDPLFKK